MQKRFMMSASKISWRVLNSIVVNIFIILLFNTIALAYDKVSEKITVKVGYIHGYGIVENIESLDRKGFGYEVLARAEHYSNYRFEYIEYDQHNIMDALIAGEIDMAGLVLDSEIRNNDEFVYIPKPIGQTQIILASKEENAFFHNDYAEIDGKTVATFYNNPYEKYLDKYCEEHGISVNYIYGELEEFLDMEADLYLTTILNYKAKDLKMVVTLETYNMYYFTRPGNKEFADSIAAAIDVSIATDGMFLGDLQLKYYGIKNLTRRNLTKEEVALLRSRTLNAGFISTHEPIQFVNEQGQADGMSIEIMKILAEKYGFSINFVPYTHDLPNEYHENFDIIVSATGDFQHEMAHYIPTTPFMELPLMLFSEKTELENIVSAEKSSILGMLNYITVDLEEISMRYPHNTIKLYTSFDEIMADFVAGELDGMLSTIIGAEFAQAQLGAEMYSMASTGLNLPLRVFVSRDSNHLTEYIGAFNIMFEHIAQTTIDEVMSTESIRFLPEYSATVFVEENVEVIIAIMFGIMVAIIFIVIYLQSKRRDAILKVINYDEMTGLISLYYFKKLAHDVLSQAKENEYEAISIDVDSFHTINAIFTKEKGNKVIKAIADALAKAYSGTDTLITRVIADQFMILLKRGKGMPISTICEKYISTAVKEVMGEKYHFSMSVGTYVVEDYTQQIEDVIDCAAVARMKGKQKYKFTYYNYDASTKKEQESKTNIVLRMKDALSNGEFKIVFQPKIRFSTLRVGGAEALVRWFPPTDQGMISPNEFISVFESNGFIANLDLFVFDEVCKFIAENNDSLDIPVISVNISMVTLFDERFPDAYLGILSKYDLLASKLEMEITESAMAMEEKLLISKVEEIKKLGLSLSIDDFGAGESSLNRLGIIAADTLKLDKAFFDTTLVDEKGAVVVDNVIKMAKQLKMKVVSEGVETLEQAKWLRSLGCDYAQGYFFERPMSIDDFAALLRVNKVYNL